MQQRRGATPAGVIGRRRSQAIAGGSEYRTGGSRSPAKAGRQQEEEATAGGWVALGHDEHWVERWLFDSIKFLIVKTSSKRSKNWSPVVRFISSSIPEKKLCFLLIWPANKKSKEKARFKKKIKILLVFLDGRNQEFMYSYLYYANGFEFEKSFF